MAMTALSLAGGLIARFPGRTRQCPPSPRHAAREVGRPVRPRGRCVGDRTERVTLTGQAGAALQLERHWNNCFIPCSETRSGSEALLLETKLE
jgi:hypothetical protein